MKKQINWLACRYHKSGRLEILGLYDTEKKAKNRCKTWRDFIGPLVLNKTLDEKPIEWVGAYYPILRKAKIKRGIWG
jgi:hypothetical protein